MMTFPKPAAPETMTAWSEEMERIADDLDKELNVVRFERRADEIEITDQPQPVSVSGSRIPGAGRR